MDFRHYTDHAAGLAAELVNTFLAAEDDGRGVTPGEMTELLTGFEMGGEITAAEVTRLHDLSRRLQRVFEAPDDRAAAAAVNDLLADVSPTPWISEHDGHDPHLHFARPTADVVQSVAANTAMGLAVLLCDYGKERLGVCASDTCRDVFVDTSRNAQRRYCSDGCANRSNVRAHRARQRTAG